MCHCWKTQYALCGCRQRPGGTIYICHSFDQLDGCDYGGYHVHTIWVSGFCPSHTGNGSQEDDRPIGYAYLAGAHLAAPSALLRYEGLNIFRRLSDMPTSHDASGYDIRLTSPQEQVHIIMPHFADIGMGYVKLTVEDEPCPDRERTLIFEAGIGAGGQPYSRLRTLIRHSDGMQITPPVFPGSQEETGYDYEGVYMNGTSPAVHSTSSQWDSSS
jgi:hypothetical protein